MRPATESVVITGLKGGGAASQFLLLVVTARLFGVGFRGEIALFSAAVNLIVLLVGFTGGASIVYLSAREPSRAYLHRMLAVCYGFCLALPVAVGLGAPLVGISLGPHGPLVVLVAVLNSMLVAHSCVLLAGRHTWQATLVEFLRPFSVLALALAVKFARGFHSAGEFYSVWGAASVLALVLSLPFVIRHERSLQAAWRGEPVPLARVARQLFGYGSLAQASNVAQFLNYRSLFFALERHAGLAAVGLFSTAVALAEVLWIPVNALASMTLNRVSRWGGGDATRAFVLRLTRIAFVAMGVAALAAWFMPVGSITLVLGRDFAGVRALLVRLLPGVVAMGVSVVAGSYNAGLGLYGRNLQAALAGLAITVLGFFVLIPHFGEPGAVLAMNLSYLATAGWLLAGMARRERAIWRDFVPVPSDFSGLLAERP